MVTLFLSGPGETIRLGRALGKRLSSGTVAALRGGLGAGKTTLTQGLAEGLGVPPETPVVSPSFSLALEYEGRIELYHLDLYRLEEDDFFDSGLDEYWFRPGVTVIEWAEKIDRRLPASRLEISLTVLPGGGRRVEIDSPNGDHEESIRLAVDDFRSGAGPAGAERSVPAGDE
ncbi:MAG: tRNA (adenosine(37)-N6)-threonylcarbamoyltransferase complex ATPase subunit type 1 TsaE [Pseudomonadota bacterium]